MSVSPWYKAATMPPRTVRTVKRDGVAAVGAGAATAAAAAAAAAARASAAATAATAAAVAVTALPSRIVPLMTAFDKESTATRGADGAAGFKTPGSHLRLLTREGMRKSAATAAAAVAAADAAAADAAAADAAADDAAVAAAAEAAADAIKGGAAKARAAAETRAAAASPRQTPYTGRAWTPRDTHYKGSGESETETPVGEGDTHYKGPVTAAAIYLSSPESQATPRGGRSDTGEYDQLASERSPATAVAVAAVEQPADIAAAAAAQGAANVAPPTVAAAANTEIEARIMVALAAATAQQREMLDEALRIVRESAALSTAAVNTRVGTSR
jgi:hypothetical protein